MANGDTYKQDSQTKSPTNSKELVSEGTKKVIENSKTKHNVFLTTAGIAFGLFLIKTNDPKVFKLFVEYLVLWKTAEYLGKFIE